MDKGIARLRRAMPGDDKRFVLPPRSWAGPFAPGPEPDTAARICHSGLINADIAKRCEHHDTTQMQCEASWLARA
jgi:hypothetical protein